MKRKYFLITITLLSLLIISCQSQNKDESKSISLEDCYKKNLDNSTLMTGWYYISDSDSGFVRQLDKTAEFYKINPFPIVTAEDMTTLNVEKDKWKNIYLLIKFGTRGTESWRVATEKAVGKELALIVDDKLLYTPHINSEITVGVASFGRSDYSEEEFEKVKQMIENNRKNM